MRGYFITPKATSRRRCRLLGSQVYAQVGVAPHRTEKSMGTRCPGLGVLKGWGAASPHRIKGRTSISTTPSPGDALHSWTVRAPPVLSANPVPCLLGAGRRGHRGAADFC